MAGDFKEDPDKKIFELTEIVDERTGRGRRLTDVNGAKQTVILDGRSDERGKSNSGCIHELTDVVEDRPLTDQGNEALVRRTEEIIEKIARQMIPEIAQRVIREEIDKIKAESAKRPLKQD